MNQQSFIYLALKEHQGLKGVTAGRIVCPATANFSKDWWIAYPEFYLNEELQA